MSDPNLRRCAAALLLVLPVGMYAQGRGGRGAAPQPAKTVAPIDLTGYWTAVITEDWHTRMLTAPKGDFGTGTKGAVTLPGGRGVGGGGNPATLGNIPYNAAGGKAAMEWDSAKDEAEGNQCKAYGAPGILRQPTHLHITWQDDNTLKMEADFGTQTRLFHFAPAAGGGMQDGAGAVPVAAKMSPPGEAPSWQGYSVATWRIQGGKEGFERGGSLTVVTTNLKPGYYWKNGMPYTGNAVLTEHFRVIDLPDSGQWLTFSSMATDPAYLNQPYIVTYQFKKLPDGSKWNPTPCSAK
jgi:hypothetical protein